MNLLMMSTLFLLGPLGPQPEIDAASQSVDAAQLKCLERAVLVESASVESEPLAASLAVAYVLHRRTLDGRWGSTDCETVYLKYPSVKNQIVRTRAKVKIGKKTLWRKITRFVRRITYTHDVSGMAPRFEKLKGKPWQQSEAHLAAFLVLSGSYTPPQGFEEMLHYRFPAKSDKSGASWFDCVGIELGKVNPHSVHVEYKDADDATLAARYEAKPECHGYIDHWRVALSRKKDKLNPALGM